MVLHYSTLGARCELLRCTWLHMHAGVTMLSASTHAMSCRVRCSELLMQHLNKWYLHSYCDLSHNYVLLWHVCSCGIRVTLYVLTYNKITARMCIAWSRMHIVVLLQNDSVYNIALVLCNSCMSSLFAIFFLQGQVKIDNIVHTCMYMPLA